MAKVEIVRPLLKEIIKKFKGESYKILDLLETSENNPHKGKPVGQVGGVVIKELKYNSYRFYFISDGHKIKFLRKEDLGNLLIKFVRMSDKKDQQIVINEIKHILRRIGEKGF